MLDFDRFTIAPTFSIFGEAATYTPPAGPSVACRVVREGGGKPVNFGLVTAYLESLSFDVRAAELPAPAPGGVFLVGSTSYTVTGAPYHPEDDAHGLVWCCPILWGTPVVYRSVSGTGATMNPPIGDDYKIAAAAIAGAPSVNIKALLITGQLRPGDKAVIGGQTYSITNTVSAASSVFTGVALSPALAAPAALNAPVTFIWARDVTVLAGIAGYDASEVAGGILVGDRRLIVMQERLTAAGVVDLPKASDKVTFEGRQFNVQSAAGTYQNGAPLVWDIQCRG